MRKFKIDNGENINTIEAVDPKGCNAITFINVGSDVAFVNNRPIPVYAAGMQEYPSITYCGLENEIMTGSFNVKFGTITGPNLLVVRKYYV
jgi:hypothetical protein